VRLLALLAVLAEESGAVVGEELAARMRCLPRLEVVEEVTLDEAKAHVLQLAEVGHRYGLHVGHVERAVGRLGHGHHGDGSLPCRR